MKGHVVLRYVGMVMLLNAFFMLAAACVSLANDMDTGFYPLMLSFVLTAIMGGFPFIFVTSPEPITTKESYVIVVSAWAMVCLTGMLPYVLWGGEFTLVNAWFESVSGYTTTGSTIVNDVEALPKGLLFWRSCTHLL
ncbi:MAG: TrkH family potassium uptake protein, partial [Rikenellaceae bacterium]|nr:TrkH family potassium uptake protein [Rikenellaceae bacterium]